MSLFDVDVERHIAEGVQRIDERRHAERLELLPGHRRHHPAARGRAEHAFDGGIVHQHDVAVGGQVRVGLDGVGAVVQRASERGDGVFTHVGRGAAVTE
jgi:hypothetical protein